MVDFLYILFFHALGDFVFQNQWMSENKHTYGFVMFFHCVLWTGIIALGFEYILKLPLDEFSICFLLGGHYLMDKQKHPFANKDKAGKTFDLDFVFHFIQLLLVYIWIRL